MGSKPNKPFKIYGRPCCCIPNCNSPVGVSYHRFPTESTLRSEWIRRCKRKDKMNPESARICGRHFTPEDFERDLKNELLGMPLVKRLKRGSVPTLHLPTTLQAKRIVSACPKKPRKKKRSKQAPIKKESDGESPTTLEGDGETLSEDPNNGTSASSKPSSSRASKHSSSTQPEEGSSSPKEDTPLSEYVPPKHTLSITNLDAYFPKPTLTDEIWTERIQALSWKGKYLRMELRYGRLKQRFATIHQELRDSKKLVRKFKSKAGQKDIVKEFLKGDHTPSQIQKILNPKSLYSQSYDKTDITTALELRSISNRAFEYVRKKNLIPLPSKRTQEKWLQEYNSVEPGMQRENLKIEEIHEVIHEEETEEI
eukprot:TRINITY_DN2684_c0_g1_i1.p1 TRINITY_DN2684_c0_g1~~TRINITY_DN2684_c0_g1_i1.p1  ORF type:complete len:368 (-),score=100.70 TRINITY_DN2684_c0_g1_i1:55-1158(-)